MKRLFPLILLFTSTIIYCQDIKIINRQIIDTFYSHKIIDIKQSKEFTYVLGKVENQENEHSNKYSITSINCNENVIKTQIFETQNVDGYNSFVIINGDFLIRGFKYGKDLETTDYISYFDSNIKLKWNRELETFTEGGVETLFLDEKIYCLSNNKIYTLDLSGKILGENNINSLSNTLSIYSLKQNELLVIGFNSNDRGEFKSLEFVKLSSSFNQISKNSINKLCNDCFPSRINYQNQKIICLFELRTPIPKVVIFDYDGSPVDSISAHPDLKNYYKSTLIYNDIHFEGKKTVISGKLEGQLNSSNYKTILIVVDENSILTSKLFDNCSIWSNNRVIKIGNNKFYLITEVMRNYDLETNIELIEFEL